MVKIVIENLGKKEVPVNDFSKTVLDQIHEQRVDWMHACGKKGRCTTCSMIVVQGNENLSPLSEAELKYKGLGTLPEGSRLACQTRTTGNLVIRVPEAGKLPHLHYS